MATAGGGDLQDAAQRLAVWAEPVVEIADLQRRLDGWLPAAVCEAPVAALTRRLLCDAAGLARTSWSTHAVSVAALEGFARAAMGSADDAGLIDETALWHAAAAMTTAAAANALATTASVTRIRPSVWATTDMAGGAYARFGAALGLCSDDAGLIDETRLRDIAQQQGWDMSVDELVKVCGLPRLHGSLAMDATAAAAAKAALTELGRPATLQELADITGRRYGTINSALARVGSVRWISRGARTEPGLLAVCDPAQPAAQ